MAIVVCSDRAVSLLRRATSPHAQSLSLQYDHVEDLELLGGVYLHDAVKLGTLAADEIFV